MKIDFLKIKGTWREVADSANTTIQRDPGLKEPTPLWKRRMLLSEHSPIRQLLVRFKWSDLKYWVSVHFVRHKFGIEHWVRTQRSDRTGAERDEADQGSTVEHEALANAQAVINISRKRLCAQASPETREAWQEVLAELRKAEPELVQACVPDCVYRGWCYEFRSCGYHLSDDFQAKLKTYREGINIPAEISVKK
jgi:hypothetical protein